MKNLRQQTAYWLTLISGLFLLYIGINFYLQPVQATLNYGITTGTNGDYSFQYIKGVRDFLFGAIIIWLLFKKQHGALGYLLLWGALIPTADFIIVFMHPGSLPAHLYAHAVATIICISCGLYYIGENKY